MFKVNLNPAKWIWTGFDRTLANSVFYFRDFIKIVNKQNLVLHVHAESNFRIFFNRKLVYQHVLISDPRWTEIAKVIIPAALLKSKNELLIHTCFYSNADENWVPTKPGLIYKIIQNERVISFSNHNTKWSFDYRYSQYNFKRAHIIALQEIVNLNQSDYFQWKNSTIISSLSDKPTLCAINSKNYEFSIADSGLNNPYLVERSYSGEFVWQQFRPVKTFNDLRILTWNYDPEIWFLNRPNELPYSENFVVEYQFPANLKKNQSVLMDFKLEKTIVGLIEISFETSENAIIEIIEQELFDRSKSVLADGNKYEWQRIIARKGRNHFLSFANVGINWIQLNIREANFFKLDFIRVHRQVYLPKNLPNYHFENQVFQKVMTGMVNMTENMVKPYIYAASSREKQQYVGHGEAICSMLSYLTNDNAPRYRYFETVLNGQSANGCFQEVWPAGERVEKIGLAKFGLTYWRNHINMGCQFVEDMNFFYKETGDLSYLQNHFYQPVKRYLRYLLNLKKADLMPPHYEDHLIWDGVTEIATIPWIKNDVAHLTINLYVLSLLKIFQTWSKLVGNNADFNWGREVFADLQKAINTHWKLKKGIYVVREENEYRIDQKALGLLMIYDLVKPDWNLVWKAIDKGEISLKAVLPIHESMQYIKGMQHHGLDDRLIDELNFKWMRQRTVEECGSFTEFWTQDENKATPGICVNSNPWLILLHSVLGFKILDKKQKNIQLSPRRKLLGNFHLKLYLPHGTIFLRQENNHFIHHVTGDIKITYLATKS